MTKMKKNLYEGMYILSSSLSEDALKKGLDRVTKTIESLGGEIHKVFDQGRKKLAYEVKGHKQGQYYLIYFSVAPGALIEMNKEYHLNEDLIRFMNLRTEVVPEKIEFKQLVEV